MLFEALLVELIGLWLTLMRRIIFESGGEGVLQRMTLDPGYRVSLHRFSKPGDHKGKDGSKGGD